MPVNDLMQKNRSYSPVFAQGLSNHTSMALIALDRLGGDGEHQQRLYDHLVERLEPLPVARALVTDGNFYNRLGQREDFTSYLDFFDREADGNSAEEVVRRFLPRLLPGVSGGAFHPLIRLAYGYMQDDSEEMQHALAYWASDYTELAPLPAVMDEFEPFAVLEELRMTVAPRYREPKGLIVERLVGAAGTEGFTEACAVPGDDPDALAKLAGAALWLYLTVPNITSLHCVTALHALRVVSPLLEAVYRANALAYAWQAVCAAYITCGAPPAGEPAGSEYEKTVWEKARTVALDSRDVHTIKLVFTCMEEYKVYNDSRYFKAAEVKALRI